MPKRKGRPCNNDATALKKNAAKEAADTAFLLMLSIPMSVLHDKHGWGKVRCERFIDQVLDLYDSFEKDYVALDDLEKCLGDEAGIKIERSSKNGKWFKVIDIEGENEKEKEND